MSLRVTMLECAISVFTCERMLESARIAWVNSSIYNIDYAGFPTTMSCNLGSKTIQLYIQKLELKRTLLWLHCQLCASFAARVILLTSTQSSKLSAAIIPAAALKRWRCATFASKTCWLFTQIAIETDQCGKTLEYGFFTMWNVDSSLL